MRRILSVVVLLLLVLAGGALGVRSQTESTLAAVKREAFGQPDLDQLIAEQQHLVELRLFSQTGTRDAGEVLNRFVALDGGTPTEAAPVQVAPWADPAVYSALKCPSSPGQAPNFPSCIQDIPPIDTSVLSALMPFDTWDPASSGAWQRYLAAPRSETVYALALPNFTAMGNLAKLRLVQGMASGDPLPALQEVRQLARLTWSTQILAAQMVAVTMLDRERNTYDAAVGRDLMPADAWTPISQRDTKALKRVAYGMVGLYAGQGPVDALANLYHQVPQPLAECSAVREAMGTMRFERAIFDEPYPGELEVPLPTAAISEVVASGRCRFPDVKGMWEDRSRDLDLLDGADSLAHVGVHVPFIRQLLAAALLQVARPHWNQYRDAAI